MSAVVSLSQPRGDALARISFGCSIVVLAVAACALAGWAPIAFSIATVFLFAGPHNWLEARYMIGRMPPKWGALRPYYLLGIFGVLGLFVLYALLPLVAQIAGLQGGSYLNLIAVWNTAFGAWVMSLAWLRSAQPPRRSWGWILPAGLVVLALNWLHPFAFSMGLVYLHPLIAFVFLDRELAKRKPAWLRTYRTCMAVVPLLLVLLVVNLATASDLAPQSSLAAQITRHAGSDLAGGVVCSRLLVACHAFLEMLHYGVWVLAIPLLSVRRLPWQVDNVALAKKSAFWKHAIILAIAAGALVVVVLWAAFFVNYETTRHIYFTIAMLHVLAEFPFLLRQL